MLKKDLRKNIVISSVHNTNLFGLLHVPHTHTKPPLVICFHGLASHKYGSKNYLVHLSKKLAAAGLASFRVDFRGSGDSEGDITQASLQDFLDDALHIIQASTKFSEINAQKIGIFGSSLGASLALLSLQNYSEYISALALWAPVISGHIWLKDMMAQTKENSSNEINTHNVSLNFQEQFLNMNLTPLLQKLPAHLKILHMQGLLDNLVSINHQKAFVEFIDASIANLTINTYEDAAHMLGEFAQTSNILNEITSWFSHQLV